MFIKGIWWQTFNNWCHPSPITLEFLSTTAMCQNVLLSVIHFNKDSFSKRVKKTYMCDEFLILNESYTYSIVATTSARWNFYINEQLIFINDHASHPLLAFGISIIMVGDSVCPSTWSNLSCCSQWTYRHDFWRGAPLHVYYIQFSQYTHPMGSSRPPRAAGESLMVTPCHLEGGTAKKCDLKF